MPKSDFTHPDLPARPWHFRNRQRPPWWPENEPWPPKRRYWRNMGGHYPFFRRLGCLFAAFSFIGLAVFISIFILVINSLGINQIPISPVKGLLPIAGIFLGIIILFVFFAGTNLRRISVPLDDLLAASNKVAEGDYSTRVDEKGPPEVLSLTKAFNSMASRLQVNDQQRKSLLADISHELRTPLTIIQGNLEGVLDGLYTADEARLKSILEETMVLSRLIEDLRTLALVESGTLEIKLEPTDLVKLVKETTAGYEFEAGAAGINMDLSSQETELVVEVDPERIRQVLSNLLTNAIRYTPRNGMINVELTTANSGPRKLANISVADNGPGISEVDLPHIFDRFYKTHDSHGMGLGLSIAKYIVEAHQGELKVVSEAGNGTTITLSIPY
jgi:two-component system sensor histidine kinase BaeS